MRFLQQHLYQGRLLLRSMQKSMRDEAKNGKDTFRRKSLDRRGSSIAVILAHQKNRSYTEPRRKLSQNSTLRRVLCLEVTLITMRLSRAVPSQAALRAAKKLKAAIQRRAFNFRFVCKADIGSSALYAKLVVPFPGARFAAKGV